MKRILLLLCACTALVLAGCANQELSVSSEEAVNSDFEAVVKSVGTSSAPAVFAAYDAKYGTTLSSDFASQIKALKTDTAAAKLSSSSSSSGFAEHTNMPFATDGAVYLSGGGTSAVGKVIAWVSPKTFPGSYYHGAVLDLDKYDSSNEDAECLETAVTKGAGYQSATEWRNEVNACVLNPNFTVDQAKLDTAQSDLDYYCKDSNTNIEYGFFKNYVNIFNVVTKADNYTWYCTKVVWRMWNDYGIDIDSNSDEIDYTNSGLYSLIKAYYTARYPFSSSKRSAAISAYIESTRKTIVLAEEIMCSPYLTKVYELIQNNG